MHQMEYESYRHAIETSNPAVQVVMLYDAAINYVKQAKEAIKENDHDKRYQLVDKAMGIMRGLRACLDFRVSEEIAATMDKYYDALDRLLIELQCNQSKELCDAIINNLVTIRNSWENINIVIPPNAGEPYDRPKDLLV